MSPYLTSQKNKNILSLISKLQWSPTHGLQEARFPSEVTSQLVSGHPRGRCVTCWILALWTATNLLVQTASNFSRLLWFPCACSSEQGLWLLALVLMAKQSLGCGGDKQTLLLHGHTSRLCAQISLRACRAWGIKGNVYQASTWKSQINPHQRACPGIFPPCSLVSGREVPSLLHPRPTHSHTKMAHRGNVHFLQEGLTHTHA